MSVPAIPPDVQRHPVHAEVAQLGVPLHPPLDALVAEVILTLVAGKPVGACVFYISSQVWTTLEQWVMLLCRQDGADTHHPGV